MRNPNIWIRITLVALAATVFSKTALRAEDDVKAAVKDAMTAYAKGDYPTAAGQLDYAAQLIRQKRGEALKKFLPKAPGGWTADEATGHSGGAAVFGGAVTAERSYTKGDARVSVKLVTDSPMLQGVLMMFTNPMFASSDGGKLERIAGQKAIVKYSDSDKSGTLNIVVGNKLLLTIEGNGVELDELKTFAASVDYTKLAATL